MSSSPSFLFSFFLVFSSLLSLAIAGSGGTFYASAVSYCSSARAIEVSTFLIEYEDSITPSVTFDISAKSTREGLRSFLDLSLNAYGMNAINDTIDLCAESLGGIVCPLPVYDFVGSATIPLPASITSKIQIPSLAFVIPDLEATAYIRLYDQKTGEESACLQVDLANGLSTRLLGVTWGLAGLLIGSVLVSILGAGVRVKKGPGNTGIEQGRRKERALTIMSWYQFVATTGLLSLKYPLVVTSFTSNFAWTLGLIFSADIQKSIGETRSKTGGNLTQLAGNLVGGTESLRTLYSRSASLPSTTIDSMNSLADQYIPATLNSMSRRAGDTYAIPTVQENAYDLVQTGFFRYTTGLEISPYNAFTTVLIFSLVFMAVYILLSLAITLPFLTRRKETVVFNINEKAQVVEESRFKVRDRVLGIDRQSLGRIIKGNALRMLIVLWFPLTLFSFFQWTLGTSDSWVPIVLSAFTFIITASTILYISICTFIFGHRSARRLKDEKSQVEVMEALNRDNLSCVPLWNQYKNSCWWYFIPNLSAMLIRALLLSFARNHGWIQSVSLLLLEYSVLVSMAITKPYNMRSTNALHISLQVLRVLVQGVLIAFNSNLELNEIIRVILGFGIIIIESLAVLSLFILVILDLISILLLLKSSKPSSSAPSSIYTRRASESTIGGGGSSLSDHSEVEGYNDVEQPKTATSNTLSDRDRSNSIARSQGSMTLADFDATLDGDDDMEELDLNDEVEEGKEEKGKGNEFWKKYIEP